MSEINKQLNRKLRKQRIRSTVRGTADRPRLTVSITNLHVSAQIIDDQTACTLAAATTVGQKFKGTKTAAAAKIGADIAKKAKKAKITRVVFDRNGRQYAARLRALAEAARQEGLDF